MAENHPIAFRFRNRPDKMYHDLAEVIRCLVQLRTELTAGRREGETGDRLERCNAVLSMVMAANIHWPESA